MHWSLSNLEQTALQRSHGISEFIRSYFVDGPPKHVEKRLLRNAVSRYPRSACSVDFSEIILLVRLPFFKEGLHEDVTRNAYDAGLRHGALYLAPARNRSQHLQQSSNYVSCVVHHDVDMITTSLFLLKKFCSLSSLNSRLLNSQSYLRSLRTTADGNEHARQGQQ